MLAGAMAAENWRNAKWVMPTSTPAASVASARFTVLASLVGLIHNVLARVPSFPIMNRTTNV
jgi:hypothetical protein